MQRPDAIPDPVRRPTRRARLAWWALYAVSFAVVIGFLVDGYSFYTTPYRERPHHSMYRELRPAGQRGLLFGATGTALLLLMHLYSVRKRAGWAARLGPMRRWLNVHIYMGIMGPVIIVLHTSFKIQGLVAVSFWAMVGVALSGFVGRYLYQQIPRNIRGDEMNAQEIGERSDALRRRMQDEGGLSKGTIARLDEMTEIRRDDGTGPLGVFMRLLASDLKRPATLWKIRETIAGNESLAASDARELADLTLEEALLRRRIRYLDALRRLLHYWHVIHKPFAAIMYLIMAVHIAVAVWTGYARVF